MVRDRLLLARYPRAGRAALSLEFSEQMWTFGLTESTIGALVGFWVILPPFRRSFCLAFIGNCAIKRSRCSGVRAAGDRNPRKRKATTAALERVAGRRQLARDGFRRKVA